MKRIYLIAGEASGDLHGSHLISALLKDDPNLELRCWGGERMEEAGASLVKHYKDLAFMGFAEVILNLRTILKNISFCKKDILEFSPDAVILLDYPGFNLRIATFLKKNNIPVHYYISPQIWAWKESRIKRIRRDVDYMYCILPFEQAFYKKHGVDVDFVGNPLLDELEDISFSSIDLFKEQHNLDDQPIIALLPGSRKQEIDRILPTMLNALSEWKNHQFVIAAAPSLPLKLLEEYSDQYDVRVIVGSTQSLLHHAEVGIITSGTATLEAALIGLPQVICYRANAISYRIATWLVKIKFIALANLIMDREVVTELIQGDCTAENIKQEVSLLLDESPRREKMLLDYDELREKLGGPGASQNVARLVLKRMGTD